MRRMAYSRALDWAFIRYSTAASRNFRPRFTAIMMSPTTKFASSLSLKVVLTVTVSPLPLSVHSVLPLRPTLFLMTALAASRMFWVER